MMVCFPILPVLPAVLGMIECAFGDGLWWHAGPAGPCLFYFAVRIRKNLGKKIDV